MRMSSAEISAVSRTDIEAAGSGTLRPVILCPAQFGTAADYDDLKKDLRDRGFALYPAPLSRFDWLRIIPSTLTKEFFTAELKPSKTLGFFYEALDRAVAQVEEDYGTEVPIAFLGHSIGGWVARSYIGEVMGPGGAERVASLVTLGTPHNPPPPHSPMAALDQTRGLLTYINANFPAGAPLPSSAVTCVIGRGTRAPDSLPKLFQGWQDKLWDSRRRRSTLVEEVVAVLSYLPLAGETFGVEGDGLIPVHTALLPGCGAVVLDACHHAAFIPTAGPSIRLPDSYPWYGSEALLDAWVGFL